MPEFWLKVNKTLRHYRKRSMIAARGRWWAIGKFPADRPIFVVGCSRAGTTLVYKTVSESREMGSLQRETHDFWAELHPPAQRDWETHGIAAAKATESDRAFVTRYFYAWTGKTRFVDKNNQNGLCVPYLHALFPDAHFVYVKRGPEDNLNSLIEGWGKPEEFATWSHDLPAQVAIDDGTYRQWCFFLADGWRDYLDRPIEDVCAFQYNAINRSILQAKRSIPAAHWHEVFYEDLVRDPVAGFRAVFSACDLAFDDRMKAHCARVLEIPYNPFSAIRLDKWKTSPNRQRITRALDQVRETARLMGY